MKNSLKAALLCTFAATAVDARADTRIVVELAWKGVDHFSVGDGSCNLRNQAGERVSVHSGEPLSDQHRRRLRQAYGQLPITFVGARKSAYRAHRFSTSTTIDMDGKVMLIDLGLDWNSESPPAWLVEFAASQCEIKSIQQITSIQSYPRPLRRAVVRWLSAASLWDSPVHGPLRSRPYSYFLIKEGQRCMQSRRRCDQWQELIVEGFADMPLPEPYPPLEEDEGAPVE